MDLVMRGEVILTNGTKVAVIWVGKLIVVPEISEEATIDDIGPLIAEIAQNQRKPVAAVVGGIGVMAHPDD